GFAEVELTGGERVEFLPGLRVVGKRGLDDSEGGVAAIDLLVLVAGDDGFFDEHADAVRRLVLRDRPAVITCVDREALASLRAGAGGLLREVVPDVVVFDESFAGRAVPFGAFTARRDMFAGWNRLGKSTFHSTTFQPNTVST